MEEEKCLEIEMEVFFEMADFFFCMIMTAVNGWTNQNKFKRNQNSIKKIKKKHTDVSFFSYEKRTFDFKLKGAAAKKKDAQNEPIYMYVNLLSITKKDIKDRKSI